MPNIESALERWGMSQKEIKVYVALLELGEATVVRLAEVTRINRTTLYDILTALVEKGLAGSTVKDKIKYFYASKPRVLVETLKERLAAVQAVLPELVKRMGTVGKRPKIEFYEGPKGIDAVHEDVLSTAKQINAYGSYDIANKAAKYQSLDFRKRRLKHKISMTAITDQSVTEIELRKLKEYRKLTTIFIDEELRTMPTWTYIYENKVAILSFEKEQFFGVVIESPSIVAKEQFIFAKLMKQSKPVD